MKKIALLALLPLTLGSCGLFGTPKSYAINGTINGTAPTGTVKLAVVGVTSTGVVNDIVGQITVFSNNKYSADYPSNPSNGFYQVIAFIDANGDGKYQVTETRTKLDTSRYLVYSKDGDPNLKYAPGWNYLKSGTASQPTLITDYDLNW